MISFKWWPLVSRKSRDVLQHLAYERLRGWNEANKKLRAALEELDIARRAKKRAEAAMSVLRGDHVQAARGRFPELSDMIVIESVETRRERTHHKIEIELSLTIFGSIEKIDRIHELGGVDFRGTEWRLRRFNQTNRNERLDSIRSERSVEMIQPREIEVTMELVALAPSPWDGVSEKPVGRFE